MAPAVRAAAKAAAPKPAKRHPGGPVAKAAASAPGAAPAQGCDGRAKGFAWGGDRRGVWLSGRAPLAGRVALARGFARPAGAGSRSGPGDGR